MAEIILISFREFAEVFLIIGLFFNLSREMKLKREKEIILASLIGIMVCISVPILSFLSGQYLKTRLTKENMEVLENLLQLISSILLVTIVISLHNLLSKRNLSRWQGTSVKSTKGMIDFSLATTIFFLIAKEGGEITLFTSAQSLVFGYLTNITGLLVGFLLAACLGVGVYISASRFPINRIFRLTEYLLIGLAGMFFAQSIVELAELILKVSLDRMWLISFLKYKLAILPSLLTISFWLTSYTLLKKHNLFSSSRK